MKGDRHWATKRSHNRRPAKRPSSKGLTAKQRRTALHAISNRGSQEDSMSDETNETPGSEPVPPAEQADGAGDTPTHKTEEATGTE